ncbi:MAG TPA: ABC transporter permease [Caldimonas sp.]|nr:ABC transporter permease [Caldimonas sp.]
MSAAPIAGWRPRLLQLSASWAIWGVLAALLVAAALLSSAFLEPVYLANVVRQAAPVGIAAIGATVVMILGGVDLSVGAVVSFAAVFAAIQMNGDPARLGPAIAWTLLASALLGLVNGALIAWNRASSFILTLGSALAIYGATQLYSGGTARGIVAPGFREFFNLRLGDVVPVLALVMVAFALFVEALLRFTRFGRSVYLIGSNAAAARISGLSLARVTIAAYTISGLFAGLAGLALLARSGVSTTSSGRGFELDTLAAIVLGGTVFEGGRGSAIATVGGVLVLFVAFNIVNILGLNFNLQLTVKGLIVIVASAIYARLNTDR